MCSNEHRWPCAQVMKGSRVCCCRSASGSSNGRKGVEVKKVHTPRDSTCNGMAVYATFGVHVMKGYSTENHAFQTV